MKLRLLKCQSGNKRLRIDKIPPSNKTRYEEDGNAGQPPTSLHDLGKHLELSGCIERHEIHATISAEIAPIEPVPVLKIRRWWEVMVVVSRLNIRLVGRQVWPGLGQLGASSPQTCARAPSRTENSYGYQLSCGIFLKHKHGFTLWLGCPEQFSIPDLLFIHSARSGLLRRGFPSGPILAGFWPRQTPNRASSVSPRILKVKM